jgi:hypothetical protein
MKNEESGTEKFKRKGTLKGINEIEVSGTLSRFTACPAVAGFAVSRLLI